MDLRPQIREIFGLTSRRASEGLQVHKRLLVGLVLYWADVEVVEGMSGAAGLGKGDSLAESKTPGTQRSPTPEGLKSFLTQIFFIIYCCVSHHIDKICTKFFLSSNTYVVDL